VTAVEIASLDLSGTSGAVWSLPHGGDLDANIVVLQPGTAGVAPHRNDEVDVVFVGVSGSGILDVDGARSLLGSGRLVHVPKGTVRAVHVVGDDALVYVTVHRARPPLAIRSRSARPTPAP
jgi:mannose-6-phosphate isomerase-like protein (cupin superfamily)